MAAPADMRTFSFIHELAPKKLTDTQRDNIRARLATVIKDTSGLSDKDLIDLEFYGSVVRTAFEYSLPEVPDNVRNAFLYICLMQREMLPALLSLVAQFMGKIPEYVLDRVKTKVEEKGLSALYGRDTAKLPSISEGAIRRYLGLSEALGKMKHISSIGLAKEMGIIAERAEGKCVISYDNQEFEGSTEMEAYYNLQQGSEAFKKEMKNRAVSLIERIQVVDFGAVAAMMGRLKRHFRSVIESDFSKPLKEGEYAKIFRLEVNMDSKSTTVGKAHFTTKEETAIWLDLFKQISGWKDTPMKFEYEVEQMPVRAVAVEKKSTEDRNKRLKTVSKIDENVKKMANQHTEEILKGGY